MALQSGTRLGHYEITSLLGAGGMGEVYIAEDTKLSRKVALKVLPPEMTENAERRARFEREAKAVAALDHPNIVTIHSVEEAEGVHFYTMQLVKGKTLTELIPKKGMALNKFFEIGIPLTDAVSAAHEQGIIHRDLKPDNLMVSDDGRLKILDFGLAKLKLGIAEEGTSELPTQSATAEGRILGTVAYMSPEQAEGKQIDNRSDIFSIGIILYEMATGERPFKGDTAASLLSSILKDTPTSVTSLNHKLPTILARIIKRCLVKDTEHRYQTAKDLRNELEELKQEVESGEVSERAIPHSRPVKWMIGIAVAIVATAAVTYLLMRGGRDIGESQAVPVKGNLTQLTSEPGPERFPSLSPDSENVVYTKMESGKWNIYLKRVGGERVINLTEDSLADNKQPAYSPDGEFIAFRSEREGGGIFLMGATGESVRRLSDFGFNPAWSPDGKEIVFATEEIVTASGRGTTSQLWAVDVANGEKRLITERDAVQPSWSPDGSRIAYWSIEDAEGMRTTARDIWTISAKGGEPAPVTQDAHVDWNPVWSRDGRYLYFSSDRGGSMNLWRVRVDESSGKVLGQYEAVTTGASASRQHLSVSIEAEQIAYVERVVSQNLWKVGFDPVTDEVLGKPIPITQGSRLVGGSDISPDGDWLVYRSFGQQEDIFIIRPDGTGLRQLTDDLYRDRRPRWSPDGNKIAFYSNRSGSHEIWTINRDGSGLQKHTETPGVSLWFPTWSPDGLRIAYTKGDDRTTYICQFGKSPEEQTPEALPLFSEEGKDFRISSWSPDGKWLAGYLYGDVGIAIYNLESQQYRRLTSSGYGPKWMSDNRRLLFFDSDNIFQLDSRSGRMHEVLSISPDVVGTVSVSRDNRWIYFTRQISEADIWMLTLNEEQ